MVCMVPAPARVWFRMGDDGAGREHAADAACGGQKGAGGARARGTRESVEPLYPKEDVEDDHR